MQSWSFDILNYHSFSGPNVCLARMQMELCRAANIFAAKIKSQHFGVSLKFWFVIESIAYKDQLCVKTFHFKCVFIRQPVSEISEFLTAYIQLKP